MNKKQIQLEVEQLSKHFGGLKAVNNVSFSINAGEIVGLIGPNGSGKTTVFGLITGYHHYTGGTVRFNGHEIKGMKPHAICKQGICRTFQISRPLMGMTVLENAMVGAFCRTSGVVRAREEAMKCLEFVGLKDRINSPVEALNVVQRRTLELAKVLATKPQLLLLDEVITGLHPRRISVMLQLLGRIQEEGITIMIIEHIWEAIAPICNRIIVLNNGKKIAEGTPAEVKENPVVLKIYLGETDA